MVVNMSTFTVNMTKVNKKPKRKILKCFVVANDTFFFMTCKEVLIVVSCQALNKNIKRETESIRQKMKTLPS
jgi:hypothetical protein